MTFTATRRFAFGASLALGIAAAVIAAALVSALVTSPEQVLVSMSDPDIESLFRLVLRRLASAAIALARLL
jgi:hypothetical protein